MSFYLLKLGFSIDYFQFRQFQHGFEVAHFMVIDCTYELMFNERFDTIKSGGEIASNYNSQSQGSQMGRNSAVYINRPINAQRFEMMSLMGDQSDLYYLFIFLYIGKKKLDVSSILTCISGQKIWTRSSNTCCSGWLGPSLLFSPSELFKLWSLHVQLTAFLIKQIKKKIIR